MDPTMFLGLATYISLRLPVWNYETISLLLVSMRSNLRSIDNVSQIPHNLFFLIQSFPIFIPGTGSSGIIRCSNQMQILPESCNNHNYYYPILSLWSSWLAFLPPFPPGKTHGQPDFKHLEALSSASICNMRISEGGTAPRGVYMPQGRSGRALRAFNMIGRFKRWTLNQI